MNQKKFRKSYILAGLIFAAMAVVDTKDLILDLMRGESLLIGILLRILGYAVVAVGLFTSRKVWILATGFVLALIARILGQNDLLSILACFGIVIFAWCGDYERKQPGER